MLDTEDIFLLDVRTQSEFDEGHIKYANLIGVTQLSSRLDEVPSNETILVYCKSGVRSASASNTLVGAGYTDVYNMDGGITAWKAAGYPVVTYDIYDDNENYVIDIEEISTSIDDYLVGQLEISEISQLVDYFLSGDEYC
ncbi:rhodanese-like domain-containing protein [Methanohalophilus halophilus]|nr:rhodanese-like domain-containing protein [Methanohalophilus halophilus]